MKNMWKKIIPVIIFFIVMIIINKTLVLNGVRNYSDFFINTKALENAYYIVQIICGICLLMGTIVAVWQYILSVKDSKNNRDREYQLHQKEIFEMEKDRIQKAIDLSGYYKDYIIKDLSILINVYTTTGVIPILNKIDSYSLKYFDKHEMEALIAQDDIKKIQNITKDKKMVDALTIASEVTGLWEECKETITVKKDERIMREVTVSADAIIYKFRSMVRDLLNNLEYFAMNFIHGTADESVVYQSLHKTYIETVKTLYYDIASNNMGAETKLFTNVIDLYNLWSERAQQQRNIEIAATRESISKGNSLKVLDKK